MKHIRLIIVGCALLSLSVLSAGCNTTGESAGLGAAIGAGVGAIIGNQSGNAGEGALIGAAIGGLSGAVAHDVKETRAEKRYDAAQTIETYDYEPAQGESLVFEDGRVGPVTVPRDTYAEATMQYAILGTGVGKEVTETRVVKRDGEVISQISAQRFTRNDGTWVSNQQFKVPSSWEPGEYTLEQTAQTAQSTVFGNTKFYVD